MARRNLTEREFEYFIGKRHEAEKSVVTNPEGVNQYTEEADRQNGGQPKTTAEKIAEQFNLSPRHVERAAQFSSAVDKLEENLGGDIKNKILSQEIDISKKT